MKTNIIITIITAAMAFMACNTLVEQSHICRAAGRRSHHIVVGTENIVVMLNEFLRFALESGISHRLATARLALGIFDVESKFLEQLECSHSHAGV